jgi:PAS domain-containing protein
MGRGEGLLYSERQELETRAYEAFREDGLAVLGEDDLRYRLLFEVSAEGMVLAAEGGGVLDANPEACRILRRARQELASAGFDAFFDMTDPRLEPALAELRHAGRFKGELAIQGGAK